MTKIEYNEFYKKHTAFYRTREWAKKTLVTVNGVATATVFVLYGYLLSFLHASGSQRVEDVLRIIAIPASCFVLAGVIRIVINRNRPYEDGIDSLVVKHRKGKSFPSRHLACAFVIGVVGLFYSLPLGIVCIALGTLLVYTRFALGIHYPTDLLCGMLFGIAVGLFAWLV